MTPLSDAQKQLLFDYSFGLTDARDTAEVEELLASRTEAAELYELLQSALSPLESVEMEPCPDELAESTIQRLKEQAEAVFGRGRAQPVRTVPVRVPLWRNWTEIAAVAAVIVVFVGVLFPALGSIRQRQLQQRCQANLAGIYNGVASYTGDHNGQFPTVAIAAGSPWWRIGAQGPENHSNTRGAWQLVRQSYVPLGAFICAARRQDSDVNLSGLDVTRYNDFPGRSFVHYSFRVDCPQSNPRSLGRKRVFLADLNPLSEEFPQDPSARPSIELRAGLLRANSRNHAGRGQNVLCCDGSVEFTRARCTSFSDDDIFSLQAMTPGQTISGCERPDDENDTFLP